MTVFSKKIENNTVNLMPEKSYNGNIKVIHQHTEVLEAVAVLEKYKYLGFDTETKPSFKKGERNNVALLQLACDESVFLFQLKKITDFTPLQQLFDNTNILKIGAAIRDDIKGLNQYFKVESSAFLELQDYVKEYGIEDAALKKLTAIVLGFRISKSQQVSNWEADPLKPSQITYAATDAWVSLRIYQELKKTQTNQ